MPVLITASDFKERFDISPDMADSRITPAIGAAERRLRQWVGDTNFGYAVAGSPAETAEDLKNAVAHLAYHFAINGLHFNLTSKGVVATSTISEGKAITRYLSPAEVRELSSQFLEMAREIAGPYLTDTVEETGFALIGLDETSYEAATRRNGRNSC